MNNLLNIIAKILERKDNIFRLEVEQEEEYDIDFDNDDYMFGEPIEEKVKQMKKPKEKSEKKPTIIPIKEWRNHVINHTDWIGKDEQLYKIPDDGNCFYTSIAVLHYGNEDSIRVRKEIVQYMMIMSFGDKYAENYEKYFDDFNTGKNIPKLLNNEEIKDLWGSGVDEFVKDYNDPLNIKVAYAIADTMKGLKKTDIASWADNLIIPSFASLLYKVNICIYQIERSEGKFVTHKCTRDFGSFIENPQNKKLYKIIFYNKGLNNHFDAIIKNK